MIAAKAATTGFLTKLCAGLALLGILAGGISAWTIQDWRYNAIISTKNLEITKIKADIAESNSKSLEGIVTNAAKADARYAREFGNLQRTVQNASQILQTSESQSRELSSNELCILEQAERIASGKELSSGCSEADFAVPPSQ